MQIHARVCVFYWKSNMKIFISWTNHSIEETCKEMNKNLKSVLKRTHILKMSFYLWNQRRSTLLTSTLVEVAGSGCVFTCAAVQEANSVLQQSALVPVVEQPWRSFSRCQSRVCSLEVGPAPCAHTNIGPFCLGGLCWGRFGRRWFVTTAWWHRLGLLIAVKPKWVIQPGSRRAGPLITSQDRVAFGCPNTLGAHLGFVGGVTPFGTEGTSLGGQNLIKLGCALSSLAAIGFTKSWCHCCIWVIFSKRKDTRVHH